MRAWQGLWDIDGLTATTLAMELRDLATFTHPRSVMAWGGRPKRPVASRGTRRDHEEEPGTSSPHLGRSRAPLSVPSPAGRGPGGAASWHGEPGYDRQRHQRAAAATAQELCGSLWAMAVWIRVQAPEAVPPAASAGSRVLDPGAVSPDQDLGTGSGEPL